LNEPIEAPYINERRPNMVILREQGVNGHVEMAAAFDKVGFNTVDVHMSDLLAGRISLDDFEGLVHVAVSLTVTYWAQAAVGLNLYCSILNFVTNLRNSSTVMKLSL
jgi:Phosphoribosylformylglycinamidine (FGAM) synthase, glutamine amidotransferase domain